MPRSLIARDLMAFSNSPLLKTKMEEIFGRVFLSRSDKSLLKKTVTTRDV